MNYSQEVLLQKFQDYIQCKNEHSNTSSPSKPKYKLPFDTNAGLCSGLVALWLYSVRTGTENEFNHGLQHICNWRKSNFHGADPIFEAALNSIIFLHFNYELLNSQSQASLDQSFKILLSDQQHPVMPPEFTITWVFDKDSLKQLFAETAPHKMIRISDGMHVVGFIKTASKIWFYDPESQSGPEPCASIDTVVDKVFTGLPMGVSNSAIALNINHFDIEGGKTAKIPSASKYIDATLQDNLSRNVLLHNPNILHLAVRYSDQTTLDLLFANNYVYIPWEIHNTTELNEAVTRNDMQMLAYLVSHKIPIDYRNTTGITALATAVQLHNLDMVFKLLCMGADINCSASPYQSLIDIACEANNAEAVIFLLAAGYNFNERELNLISKTFTADAKQIFSKALILHKVLLQLPDQLSLDTKKCLDVIAILAHCQLQQNLLHHLNGIRVTFKNKQYNAEEIYQAINQYVAGIKNNKKYNPEEISQITIMLDALQIASAHNANRKELLDVLSKIALEIINKSDADQRASDLGEIKVVLNNVEDLMAVTKLKVSEKKIHNLAVVLKTHILDYLTKNNVTDVDSYLRDTSIEASKKRPSMLFQGKNSKARIGISMQQLKQYTSLKSS